MTFAAEEKKKKEHKLQKANAKKQENQEEIITETSAESPRIHSLDESGLTEINHECIMIFLQKKSRSQHFSLNRTGITYCKLLYSDNTQKPKTLGNRRQTRGGKYGACSRKPNPENPDILRYTGGAQHHRVTELKQKDIKATMSDAVRFLRESHEFIRGRASNCRTQPKNFVVLHFFLRLNRHNIINRWCCTTTRPLNQEENQGI